MAIERFEINGVIRNPDYGLVETTEPRVLKSQFGDGYTQVVPDGTNTVVRKWRVRYLLREDDANEAVAFLTQRGGHEPFIFSIPKGEDTTEQDEVTVRCYKWTVRFQTFSIKVLEAEFEEVFDHFED